MLREELQLDSSSNELPLDILSQVINSGAIDSYHELKNSEDSENFAKYVKNISHINLECVTSEMLADFLASDLGENENWVDLAIELKSAEMIKKLGDRAIERIISEDDPELFSLIECDCIEEVFRRNKYRIAMSLRDERVAKVSDEFTGSGEFTVIEDGIKEIPNKAFCQRRDLKYVIIPSTVTVVRYASFAQCSSLKSITIPQSTVRIEGMSFFECSSLTSVTIPSAVNSVGLSAFLRCRNLEKVDVLSPVAKIWDAAFRKCSRLRSVTISGEVVGRVSYRLMVVTDSTLMGVGFEDSECEINGIPFEAYDDLTEFDIPSSVTRIGEYAFYMTPFLESVTIPASVTRISSMAFFGCEALKSITIPESVREIHSGTFIACSSLESITVPGSVSYIGGHVFYDCKSLKEISIPGEITGRVDSKLMVVLNGVLTGIDVSSESCAINGVPFRKYRKTTAFVVPPSVTCIGKEAFEGCKSLESIVIPPSVTKIEMMAFEECESLLSVTIPESVKSIDEEAFPKWTLQHRKQN